MEKTIIEIVQKEYGGCKILKLENKSLGWSGSSVYFAEVQNDNFTERLIIKTASSTIEVPFSEELDSDRVYGSRFSNLKPAYDLMLEKGIKIPKLISSGNEGGLSYALIECLEGDTFVPEILLAEEMGKLHSIKRKFQGWVDMKELYKKSWKEAFFSALRKNLEDGVLVSETLKDKLPQINDYISLKEKDLDEPKEFVFSHTDGFQGMAKQNINGEYEFTGVIDIEDHEFTDQRFVLAGHELMSELYLSQKLSEKFWAKYKEHCGVAETYEKFRNLFKLFYLISWIPGYYRRSNEKGMDKYIQNTERLIIDLVNIN